MNSIFQYLMDLDQQILDGEKETLKAFEYSKNLSLILKLLMLNLRNKILQVIGIIQREMERDSRLRITFKNNSCNRIYPFLLFLTFYMTIYLIIERYFEKYDQTSIIFKGLVILELIFQLYMLKEKFYIEGLQDTFQQMLKLMECMMYFQAYNKVEEFTQLNIDLSSDDYLFDENAVNFYQAINIGDLCEYQTEQFKELANSTCGLAMNGNLLKGLSQILPYILYTLKTQYDDSKNFTILPTNTRLELEGATIIGNVMSTVISELYDNLLISCLKLINFTQIPCIIFLVFQSICIVIYIAIMNENHKQQFQSIKQSIFLFPRQTLIFDDQFYRNFRSIIKDEGIQQ